MTDLIPILLVDDQTSNLTALEAILASSGCQLVLAQSPEMALLALLDREFAAIVLDVRMPTMSGLELAALIRQRKRTQHVPILFLTAYHLDHADIIRGYEAGAVDYLTKPINPVVLQSKIAVFAELYRKRRELADLNESLEKEIAEREEAQAALVRANEELEHRVAERTQALTKAHASAQESEERLRETDRRKDEFLAMLAHELRNPLAPLSNAVEILSLANSPDPRLEMAAGLIGRQVKQLTRLVDDLLDVSRISRGKLELRRQRIALEDVVQVAVETCQPMIQARNQQLTVTLPPSPVMLHADPARLTQSLMNLLNNSAKYTEPGGHIALEAVPDGNRIAIAIADDGIGIPADMLSRVFDIFVQLDQRLERTEGGLGVGLALVKNIVEMHGGTVRAASDGPGRGSRFTVELPIAKPLPGEADRDAAVRRGTRAAKQRILVAEDGPDAAESFRMLLTIMGHDVRVVSDGVQAVDAAREFRPDLIIMDLGMPRMNGYDAARAIRAGAGGSEPVIIALTGWGQPEDQRRSLEAGFDRHLTKPVDPNLLRSLLETTGKRSTSA
jgi:signal transduction histidine kinase